MESGEPPREVGNEGRGKKLRLSGEPGLSLHGEAPEGTVCSRLGCESQQCDGLQICSCFCHQRSDPKGGPACTKVPLGNLPARLSFVCLSESPSQLRTWPLTLG
jgi:hypothetical protein